MNKIYIFVVLATLYVSASAFNYEAEDSSFTLQKYLSTYNSVSLREEGDKNCTKIGLMCKNCYELVTCVKIDGKWVQFSAQNCSDKPVTTTTPPDIGGNFRAGDNEEKTEYCLINKCTSDPNPECPPGGTNNDFKCHDTGVFPDPYNCQTYHVCVQEDQNIDKKKDEHISVRCADDNYGYNPITTYCDKKLTNKACSTTPPVPPCKVPGQSGAIQGTSIFYICLNVDKKLIPNLFMCPHGGRFVSGNCV